MQSITGAKFPVNCSNRRSAGPSEKVATPATECEGELLKGRRIISNELKSNEEMSDEDGRREVKRETFTKAPSTGLVKETIPAGADKRGRQERVEERTTPRDLHCWARERRQDVRSSQGGRAEST